MAAKLPVSAGKERSLLLLGKTGHGKSATGNTILGWEAFETSDDATSHTIIAKLHCTQMEDGTVVRVVDTPGVKDTERREESTVAEIMEGMSLCPNGFHALVFVIKYGNRYTQEERESLQIFKTYFGPTFLKDFGIVVMTQGDSFDLNHERTKLSFDGWLMANEREEQSGPFDKLLEECNNRCVLFYNAGVLYSDQRKEGVEKLFQLVTQIPNIYTSVHLDSAKRAREILAKKLEVPVFYPAIQEKLSLLMWQIAKDLKNNSFSYEFMLKKIKDLNEEVNDVRTEFRGSLEFRLLRESLDSILPTVECIKNIGERGQQRSRQEQLLKDLENLSKPPSISQIFIREGFGILAKILKPISSVVNFFIDVPKFIKLIEDLEHSYKKQKAIHINKQILNEEKNLQ